MLSVLEHYVMLMLGRGQMKEMVRKTRWNLMEEAKYLPPFDECPTPNHCLVMNIIAWNCRGALKPSFSELCEGFGPCHYDNYENSHWGR